MSIQYPGFSLVCQTATTKARDIESLQRVFVMCKVKDMMSTYFDKAYDYVSKNNSSTSPKGRIS